MQVEPYQNFCLT